MAIGRQPHQVEITYSICEIKVQLAKQTIQLTKFSQVMFQLMKSTCVIPDICDRLCQIFSSYILYKSLFSPCNPLIGFLSQEVRRKGEKLFYIIYCNFLLKISQEFFLKDEHLCIVFQESNTQSFALPYLLNLFSLLFLFLATQTLRMFSQRMSGQAFCFLE